MLESTFLILYSNGEFVASICDNKRYQVQSWVIYFITVTIKYPNWDIGGSIFFEYQDLYLLIGKISS